MKRFAFASAILILANSVLAGSPALVPSPAPAADRESGWWFRVAQYGWLTATEGDMGIRGTAAPVDISFADTLDSLDLSFMGVIEAGKGRWSLGLDAIYGEFSDGADGGRGLIRGIEVEQTQVLLNPRIGYRIVEADSYQMDLLVGARWTYLELDIAFRTQLGDFRVGATEDWIDPVIGIRGRGDLTDRWFFQYYADAGGFGVGSDFTWQAYVGTGYRLTRSLSAGIGYRGLGTDYSDGGVTVDTVAHGPVIGIDFRF